MKTLALETSGSNCGIAALAGSQLIEEVQLGTTRRTAQSLAPGIRSLLQRVGWTPQQLQLVVVTQGPGSFTGLRIGVTTAKTLAYVTGAQVMGVNTLDAIAEQAGQWPVWVVLDAQRQQVFAASFDRTEGRLVALQPAQIVDNDAWINGLSGDMVVSGPALSKLRASLPPGVTVIEEQRWHPRAATVGQLGFHQYQHGRRDDLWKLVPEYFRKSAAEEKQERESSPESSA